MSDFAEHTISLDDSLAESARLAKLDVEIDARTRELFGTDGSEFGYSREEAREQAKAEVLGGCETTDWEDA